MSTSLGTRLARRWARLRTSRERARLEAALGDALARGDRDDAVALGRRLVDLAAEAFGEGHAELAPLRYALAAAHLAAGDAISAALEGSRALAITPAEASAPSRRAVLELCASAAEAAGDEEAIVSTGEALVADAERAPHGEVRDLRLADVSTRLGLALARRGRADEAWAHLSRALVLRRARLGRGDLRLAEALHNLATHRLAGSAPGEAVSRFEEAIRVARGAGPEGHPLLEAALHNLGALREAEGEDDAAASAWEEALALRQARLGPEHPSLRPTLARLAALRARTGATLVATALFERALRLAVAELGPEHPVAVALRDRRGEALGAGEPLGAEAPFR